MSISTSKLPPPAEVEGITLAEARQRWAENCTSHHHACDCREHKVAVLVKAALDAAVELDETKNNPSIDPEQRERNSQTLERVYAACNALGVVIGAGDEVPVLFPRLALCEKACEGITDETLQSWLNPPEGSLGAPHGTWSQQLADMGHLIGVLRDVEETHL